MLDHRQFRIDRRQIRIADFRLCQYWNSLNDLAHHTLSFPTARRQSFREYTSNTMQLSSLLVLAITAVSSAVAQGPGRPPQQSTTARTSSSARQSSSSSRIQATSITSGPTSTNINPPDVYLTVPTLHVGRIELDVENLSADINLNAQVANLVQINAGVSVGIKKVNLTIADVDADLELTVRLGHLADIVSRVFESLDLNPELISGIVGNVTDSLGTIVGAVDGLLGSITQGGNVLKFLVDNFGNVVQQVNGVSTIVGDYTRNMTETGVTKTLAGGLIQKQYKYTPLNSLVNIVFNSAGQVVQSTVQKVSGGGGSNSTVTAR